MFEEEQQGLIDLIEWYRDEYHQHDFCHTKSIEQIKKCKSIEELEPFYQMVDGWIDF